MVFQASDGADRVAELWPEGAALTSSRPVCHLRRAGLRGGTTAPCVDAETEAGTVQPGSASRLGGGRGRSEGGCGAQALLGNSGRRVLTRRCWALGTGVGGEEGEGVGG